jgi:Na+/H+ antiporter NhaD/arsenite permease-like protein
VNLAIASLVALVIAITLSCTSKINIGVLAVVMAWIIGVYFGGMSLADINAGFPTQLFLTLTGVTLLFTLADVNGTLGKLAFRAVRSCRGNAGAIPIMFFVLAFIFGSIGPGSIASIALLGPMAMAVAGQTGISPFLMTIMAANGAQASSLSPIAPTGIIVTGLMEKIGLPNTEWYCYMLLLVAHTLVGLAGYMILGGWRLFTRGVAEPRVVVSEAVAVAGNDLPDVARGFERPHWVTLAVIAAVITVVIALNVNVGMASLAGAVILVLIGAGDESRALRAMPWGPILMVSGVTVLVALIEKTGGMDLFSALLARLSSADTVAGVTGFITGTISIYSSTSGVVLPAFLPTVPGIVSNLGSGDPLAIASAMIVSAHLVDVSPLSTTGALCIAAAPPNTDVRRLFRAMLAWGMSMAVVGALGSHVVFGLLWSR